MPRLSRRRFLLLGVGAGLAAMAPGRGRASTVTGSLAARAIPSTGEKIPIVGLGSARTFDVKPNGEAYASVREVIRRFERAGGRLVDTSPMYGNAERVIGEAADELELGSRLFFATKVWTRGEQSGVEQMARSARRLGVTRMDLMQVHNLVDVETHLRTLRRWKEEGRVRYIGITHYTASAHDDLERIMRDQPLDFVQFNYSIAERHAEERLLPAARELGVATLINEPFQTGWLFRRVRGVELPGWADEFDCASWAQFFLKYILANAAVTCAIPATGDPNHLDDNMKAGVGRLPDEAQRRKMVRFMEQL
ncbi:MAG: aldo/keto reductase [Ectothiorhodospiraceae bacterium]|jgi:aryl-alcohol dehydrogenase-like predicted oxidoreductase